MFPHIGDKVQTNPEWVKIHAPRMSGGVFTDMKRSGFCNRILHVVKIHGDRVFVTDGYYDPIGVALGESGYYRGGHMSIPYFLLIESHNSKSYCPLCGSNGWQGINMFHCENSECQNGR